MNNNPYSSPLSPAAESTGTSRAWPFAAGGCLLLLTTVAIVGVFGWAAWFRLENTEAMGRLVVPPPISLTLIDWLMFVSGILALAFGFLTFLTFAFALHRITDG